MADYTWPDSLAPYRVDFYLQPHVGGTESPFSRQRKVYALSAPRFVCRYTVRGGVGGEGLRGKGAGMDGFLAKVGGVHRVLAWDFRRPDRTGEGGSYQDYINSFAGIEFTFDGDETFTLGETFIVSGTVPDPASEAAEPGDTSMTFTNFEPMATIFRAGDYVGGDGRPHVVTDDAVADVSGTVTVNFQPPLRSHVSEEGGYYTKVTGAFHIVSEDAGSAPTEFGDVETHEVEMVEAL